MIPFIVGCALFMQMLDSTVVATALPAMAVALGSTPVQMNVIITSYLLAVAVFVPISGWAADRFGSKRVFIAAILLRSEEHTSELQSLMRISYAVFCLKKKKNIKT